MVREHLEAIREREEKAKASVRAASKQAAEIVEKAKEEGEKLLDETRIRGNEIRRTMTAEAKNRAEARIQELRAGNDKGLAALSENARRSRGSALDLIMKRFREAT